MPLPIDDPRLLAVDERIRQIALEIFEELIARIKLGEDPVRVLNEALDRFKAEELEAIASALSFYMQGSLSFSEAKAYRVGRFALSSRLYRNAAQVTAVAKGVINTHLKELVSTQKLLLRLYEGYGFRGEADEVLQVIKDLPKYLQAPARQLTIKPLATKALRSAYMQVAEAKLREATMAELDKTLRVAWFERNRYFASRIARTEVSRAVNDRDAIDIMADEQLEFVQILLSQAHSITDICDLHAGINKYGVGKGIYPKELAPKPPFHPHCWCKQHPRYDLSGLKWREIQGARRAFVRKAGVSGGAKIVGSRAKAEEVLRGGAVITVIDRGKLSEFKTQWVGDYG